VGISKLLDTGAVEVKLSLRVTLNALSFFILLVIFFISTWFTTVLPFDVTYCVPPPSFHSIITYHRSGRIMEKSLRGPNGLRHGSHRREKGNTWLYGAYLLWGGGKKVSHYEESSLNRIKDRQ